MPQGGPRNAKVGKTFGTRRFSPGLFLNRHPLRGLCFNKL